MRRVQVADVLTSVRERWEAEGGQTTVTGPISLVGFARDEAARRRSGPLKVRERGNGKSAKDAKMYVPIEVLEERRRNE